MGYLKEMSTQGYNLASIGAFHSVMVPHIARKYGVALGDPILDIGAGQGHGVVPLRHNGFVNISAVDMDTFNFEKFERQYQVKCIKCDVSVQPLPFLSQSFQCILCMHLIEHLLDPAQLLSEIYRILKPQGVLFIVTPDWRKQYRTFYRDPTHLHPYDKESISRLLRIHNFNKVIVNSWGAAYGLGRLGAFRWFPSLGLVGADLLAVGIK